MEDESNLRRAIITTTIGLLLLPAPLLAQSRQRRASRAARVADQIKVLTRFLYLLGGVSKGIEAADVAARAGEATPAQVQQTERSKATVKTSLQNVREGLDQLEIDFRTKPGLQRF